MSKRIPSVAAVVSVVVLALFGAKYLIPGDVNANRIASEVYDSSYAAKQKILDMAAEAKRESIDAEYSQIAADIEGVEGMLAESGNAPASKEQMSALRAELGDLMKRREAVLEKKSDLLAAIDRERLEAERYFLVKLRSKAIKEEWKSLAKIVKIESNLAARVSKAQKERAADLVNRFIDAVMMLDVESARDLSSDALRNEIDLSRLRSMRRHTPSALESGFELRNGADDTLEVWAGEKLASVTYQGEKWLIDSAWR